MSEMRRGRARSIRSQPYTLLVRSQPHFIRNLIRVSLHHKGRVVDQDAAKPKAPHLSSRQKSGSKGRSCLFIFEGQVLDGADQTRRTKTRWGAVAGCEAFLNGGREGSANASSSTSIMRRPGRSYKPTNTLAKSFKEIMTGRCRCSRS